MPTTIRRTAAQVSRSTEDVLIMDLDESPQSIKGSSGAILRILFSNVNNANAHAYLKLYDAAAPEVGTDDPELILRARKGREVHVILAKGQTFETAISAAALTTGGTGGTAPPSEDVDATICVN